MTSSRGFVLLNALVLVAALAAVAAVLLARASDGQARRAAAQDSAQMQLYLDGFEALALNLLNQDARAVDHTGEAWARPLQEVALDRGRVSGQLRDLQGRFNINWVANPEDIAARAAFERLATDVGLSAARAQAIIRFLTPGGGGASQTQRGVVRRPAVAPPGGPIVMVTQLQWVPGLRAEEFARLAPHIATLPGDSTLNVNTASRRVMASLLPGVSLGAIDQLIQSRQQDPFMSLEDFMNQLGRVAGTEVITSLNPELFGVASVWFEAHVSATVAGGEGGSGPVAARHVVFLRQPLPLGTRVAYRRAQN